MTKRITVLLLCLISVISPALSWGGKGHDIIVEIAYRHLTPKAKREISALLDGRPMVYYSSWMDGIRGEYPYTSTWHYVNVNADDKNYAESAKNPRGDVYTAVMGSIDTLNMKDISKEKMLFHFKSLIHFVGDMHCPMHAGHVDDRGGNSHSVKWFGRSTSLHSLWDSKFIESYRSWSYSEWADNIDYKPYKDMVEAYCLGDVESWMDETVAAAAVVYKNTPEGGNYSWDYMAENGELLETQLQKAGIRLAYLLNQIF